MKKYLLLATTAMLFSANAMADNRGQVFVGVTVAVEKPCVFEVTKNIDFGTIAVSGEESYSGTLLTMDTNGNITRAEGAANVVQDFDEIGQRGVVTYNCPGNTHVITTSDVTTTGSSTLGSSGASFGGVSITLDSGPTAESGTIYVGGTLEASSSEMKAGSHTNDQAVSITLSF